MRTHEALRQTLIRIDGRGYKAYKEIRGTYGFPGFSLAIDSVQSDPFAAPSRSAGPRPPAHGRPTGTAFRRRKPRRGRQLLPREGLRPPGEPLVRAARQRAQR